MWTGGCGPNGASDLPSGTPRTTPSSPQTAQKTGVYHVDFAAPQQSNKLQILAEIAPGSTEAATGGITGAVRNGASSVPAVVSGVSPETRRTTPFTPEPLPTDGCPPQTTCAVLETDLNNVDFAAPLQRAAVEVLAASRAELGENVNKSQNLSINTPPPPAPVASPAAAPASAWPATPPAVASQAPAPCQPGQQPQAPRARRRRKIKSWLHSMRR